MSVSLSKSLQSRLITSKCCAALAQGAAAACAGSPRCPQSGVRKGRVLNFQFAAKSEHGLRQLALANDQHIAARTLRAGVTLSAARAFDRLAIFSGKLALSTFAAITFDR